MSRKMTYRLIEMMDEGLVDTETIAHCALMYMSEDEVAEMMHCNEIDPEITEIDPYEDDGSFLQFAEETQGV